MVVDLHPVDLADGSDPDLSAPVGELLVAVLVVQRGVPAPGRLQRLGQRRRGLRADERGPDVLAVRQRGIHQLGDPGEPAVRAGDHLHLLVGETLDVVDGDDDARPADRGEQRLLDRDGVHRVPVDQQRARGEVVTGQPERVGVVPLLGPVVVHQREPDPVLPLQRGGPIPHRVRRVADDDHDVAQADRGQVAQRDVEDGDLAGLANPVDRQQGLGQRVRVRPQPRPAPAARTIPITRRLRPWVPGPRSPARRVPAIR